MGHPAVLSACALGRQFVLWGRLSSLKQIGLHLPSRVRSPCRSSQPGFSHDCGFVTGDVSTLSSVTVSSMVTGILKEVGAVNPAKNLFYLYVR